MAGKFQFDDLGLSRKLMEAIREARFEKPTDLQMEVIPLVLEECDVIFEAQSGMGKSACFAIPFLQHWLRERDDKALIVTTSAGAVRQLGKVISRLCPVLKARVMKFTATDDFFFPELLERSPLTVIEYPALARFMKREKEYISNVHCLGLDDFGSLMEHDAELRDAISQISDDRQTLISANELNEQVLERGRWYCDPSRLEKVKIARPEARWEPDRVTLDYVAVTDDDRYENLAKLAMDAADKTVLVITNSDRISQYVADRLKGDKLNAEVLAYSMTLDIKRSIVEKVIADGNGILVGCEAAMNGLTMPNIDKLISWDLPEHLDSYWRRVDRYADQGSLVATLLIEDRRLGAIRIMERRVNRKLTRVQSVAETSRPQARPQKVAVAAQKKPAVSAPAAPSQIASCKQEVKDNGHVHLSARFSLPVFLTPKQLKELAPDGIVKTLGSKFVPARKRR